VQQTAIAYVLSFKYRATSEVSRLAGLKMINDPVNYLQINLFKGPDSLVNFGLPKEFDEDLLLPRPSRRNRE
jgi:hypothetical protein